MRLEGSNQFMLKLRGFAAHWKLLIVPIAVVAVGLAIALPISMAGARVTAGSIPARSDRVEHARAAAGPGAGCVVSYTAINWPGAFTAKVTISNRGSTSIDGWSLTFRFPGDEAISSAWNATFTQTGAEVSARNTNYDATIPPGASQSLGFLGAWTSDDAAPAAFRVNRAVCTQISGPAGG
jgi:hypothetical protein